MKLKFAKIKDKTVEIMGKIGKKTIVATGAVLVIGVAVLLNFILHTGADTENNGHGLSINLANIGEAIENQNGAENGGAEVGGENGGDYFASMALSREQARDEAMEVLQTVVSNGDSGEAARDDALSNIAQIASDIEKEATIETLLRSKGFEQCLAVINGKDASIIVATDGLMAGEVAQISEIAYEQAGILPTELKIIERPAQ